MNIRKISKEELELLSFTDIAYNLIKIDKKAKTTVELFKEICSLLGLSNREYEEKIADFFTSLTVDKRFVLLNSVNWDLKENHSIKTVVDDSEDEYEDVEEDEVTDFEEETLGKAGDEEDFEETEDSDFDDVDDDMEDLEEIDELEDLEIEEESPEELDE